MPGIVPGLEANQKQRIIAVACAGPPERARPLDRNLVGRRAVNATAGSHVEGETIRVLVLSYDLKRWQGKVWCVPELNDEYVGE